MKCIQGVAPCNPIFDVDSSKISHLQTYLFHEQEALGFQILKMDEDMDFSMAFNWGPALRNTVEQYSKGGTLLSAPPP